MFVKILVTGGTGMVGKAIQELFGNDPRYIFVGSKDGDLTDLKATRELFERERPDAVIHLAAVVGGLFYNMKNNAKMLDLNTRISLNVTRCCVEFWVKKAILVNSTCAFPTKEVFPMVETDMHSGSVHWSNEGYAMSKRVLESLGRLYEDVSETKFVTVFPCNLYGPEDNFELSSCHVLSGLLRRCHEAKEGGVEFTVWGTGTPLRQFLYVKDFARAVVRVLEDFEGLSAIICSDEEISIRDLAGKVATLVGYEGEILFDDSKSDGMMRKTVSNGVFMGTFPDFRFTLLDEGLGETYEWFRSL
jgi:GDP-L-fucose synthase